MSKQHCQHFLAVRNPKNPLTYCRLEKPSCRLFTRKLEIRGVREGVNGFRQRVALNYFDGRKALMEEQVKELKRGENGWFVDAALNSFRMMLEVFPSIDCRGVETSEDFKVYGRPSTSFMSILLSSEICKKIDLQERENIFIKSAKELTANDLSAEKIEEISKSIKDIEIILKDLYRVIKKIVGCEGIIDVFGDRVGNILNIFALFLDKIEHKQTQTSNNT